MTVVVGGVAACKQSMSGNDSSSRVWQLVSNQ